MAYRVPGPAHDTERWYVPDVEGNDEREGTDQIKVKLRHPTEGERRQFLAGFKDGQSTFGEHDAWQTQAINACVLEIQNYEDSAGKPIKTSEDLLNHGEPVLVANIAGEAGSGMKLSETQRKNSESSSGTNSAGTPA